MFKGLKTKIAEETKKIQDAVVSQVGEGINTLSRLSDASLTRSGSPSQTVMPPDIIVADNVMDANLPEFQSWTNAKAEDNESLDESAFSQNLPLRQRHGSNSSINSIDNFFSAVSPAAKMTTIPSDTETDVESVVGSSYSVTSASKEQISFVLNKLQGRAANYKEKYRELASSYRALANENEKIRVILTSGQDKALKRMQELREEKRMTEKAKRDIQENLRSKILIQDGIVAALKLQIENMLEGRLPNEDILKEMNISFDSDNLNNFADSRADKEKLKKLEELLTRCKDTIKTYKDKLLQTSTENEQLVQKIKHLEQEQGSSAEMGEFVTERAVQEYRQQIETCKIQFEKKLADESGKSALLLAELKKEMHAEIEKKEQTIEDLRLIVRETENNYNALKEKLDIELEAKSGIEAAAEKEKHDLVHELSRAQQSALKIVKEEEELKRIKMQKEFDKTLSKQTEEFKAMLDEIKNEQIEISSGKEAEFERILKERDEQTQLALEERDLQKMAALAQHDEKNDMLHAQIEELKTEKLQLTSKIEQMKNSHDAIMQDSVQKAETSVQKRFEAQIQVLKRKYDDKIAELDGVLSSKLNLIEQLEQSHASQNFDNVKRHYESMIEDMKSRYDEDILRLKTDIESRMDQLDTLKHDKQILVEDFEASRSAVDAELNEAKISLEQVFKSKLDLEEQICCLQTTNAELEQQLSSARCELEQNLEQFQIVPINQENQTTSSKLEIEELQSTFSRLQSDFSEQCFITDRLKGELETKKISYDELSAKFSCIASKEQTLMEENEQLKQNLTEVEVVLETKNQALITLQTGLTDAVYSVQSKTTQYEELLSKHNGLENASKSQKDDLSRAMSINVELSMLKDTLQQHESILQGKNQSIVELQAQLANESKFRADHERLETDLRNELNNRISENSVMKTALENISNKNRLLESTREKLMQEIADLKTENANFNHRIRSMKDEIEICRDDLQHKLNESEAQIRHQTSSFDRETQILRSELAKTQDSMLTLKEHNAQLENALQKQSFFDSARQEKLEEMVQELKLSLKHNEALLNKAVKEKSSLEDQQTLMKRKYESVLKDLRSELNLKIDEVKILEKLNTVIAEKDEQMAIYKNKLKRLSDLENIEVDSKLTMKKIQEDFASKSFSFSAQLAEKDELWNEWKQKEVVLEAELKSKCEEIRQLNDVVHQLQAEAEQSDEASQAKISQESIVTSEEVQELNGRLSELTSQIESLERQLIDKQIAFDETQEEKSALEDKHSVAQKKTENALKTLQNENRKLSENLKELREKSNDTPSRILGFRNALLDSTNIVFVEPTEVEYLRNIVFRYMVERETLGKESVNLAKAIAAVLKLDAEQTREVVDKEETRSNTW